MVIIIISRSNPRTAYDDDDDDDDDHLFQELQPWSLWLKFLKKVVAVMMVEIPEKGDRHS